MDRLIKTMADSAFLAAKTPGMLVAWSDGKTTSYYALGESAEGTGKKFTKYTKFEIGSITKTFTAYVLEKVLAAKKLNDSITLNKVLPDSLASNTSLADVRIINLLNHTSGLPRIPALTSEDSLQPYQGYGENQLLATLKSHKFEPGKHEYSNLGYGLAGYIATRLSGTSYQQLLDEYIFNPWKLSDANSKKFTERSVGKVDSVTNAIYWNMEAIAPAGNLVMDARELMNYLKYMSNPDVKDSATIYGMLEPTLRIMSFFSIGKAWHIYNNKGKTFYWHNGGTYGFSTFCAFEKRSEKAVLVVANKFDTNEYTDVLGADIMRELMK